MRRKLIERLETAGLTRDPDCDEVVENGLAATTDRGDFLLVDIESPSVSVSFQALSGRVETWNFGASSTDALVTVCDLVLGALNDFGTHQEPDSVRRIAASASYVDLSVHHPDDNHVRIETLELKHWPTFVTADVSFETTSHRGAFLQAFTTAPERWDTHAATIIHVCDLPTEGLDVSHRLLFESSLSLYESQLHIELTIVSEEEDDDDVWYRWKFFPRTPAVLHELVVAILKLEPVFITHRRELPLSAISPLCRTIEHTVE